MIQWFLDLNRRLSHWLEDRLPERFTLNFNTLYVDTVADHINARPGAVVIDVGAGKKCDFLRKVDDSANPLLIGIDISDDELKLNTQLDYMMVGDVVRHMPFAEGSADMIVSRSVVEHLYDNSAFVKNCANLLRPGGYFIHLFPGRFAPFAVLNRLLPDAVARTLLYYFHPGFREDCGFKAYYNRCYYGAIKRILEENGFEVVEIRRRYYQSIYFDFFFPFYALSLSYDALLAVLGIKNLSSQLLVVARKP